MKYTAQTVFDADYGNVTLQAATLSGGSVLTNAPVTILNPTWNGNGFSFSLATASGSTYAIEYKNSLNLISWQSLTNFAGNGSTVSVTNITTTTERFYRVGVQ